jgi:hypothetical protein
MASTPFMCWHDDIHQNDIRAQTARQVDGLFAVARHADHLHAHIQIDLGAQSAADNGVVIGDQDANNVLGHAASAAGTCKLTVVPPPGGW